jgi:hypothetical protein
MDEETLRDLRERRSILQSRGVASRYSYLMFADIVAQLSKESSADAPLSVGKTSRRDARAGNEWDGLSVGKRARVPKCKYMHYIPEKCMYVSG